MAKTISEQQRLEAFALYTMAASHYAKTREFERAASEILGADPDGYNPFLSDALYGEDPGRALPFDIVLKNAEVTVKKSAKKRRR